MSKRRNYSKPLTVHYNKNEHAAKVEIDHKDFLCEPQHVNLQDSYLRMIRRPNNEIYIEAHQRELKTKKSVFNYFLMQLREEELYEFARRLNKIVRDFE